MKKFKITYLVALAIAGLSIQSCDKNFLDTSPTDQVAQTSVFSSLSNAKLALNGMYRLLYLQISNQRQDGHGAMMINADALGEDLVWTGNTYTYFKVALRWQEHLNPTAEITDFPFKLYYRVISNANMILDNLEPLEGSAADKNALRGECLAIRAWAHFQLVQWHGKRYIAGQPNNQPGVPLVLDSTGEDQPRSSVEAVYEGINKDLTEAIALLKTATKRSYTTHINLAVANGFKARVLLTQQNWAEAANYAQAAREGFSLMSTAEYVAGFTDISNGEWMWGSSQQADQVPTYGSYYSYMSANFNSSWGRLEPKAINSVLFKKLSNSDIRKKLFWDGTAADKVNFTGVIDVNTGVTASTMKFVKYMHRKFRVPNYTSRAGDIPYMRAAEMYLIEAEALANITGKEAEAKKVLFDLAVKRDPQYSLSSNTGQALLDEIYVQRRIELWGEGFRYFDLKRLDQALDRNGMDNPMVSANIKYLDIAYTMYQQKPSAGHHWEFKIPQDEIDVNTKMSGNDQNP